MNTGFTVLAILSFLLLSSSCVSAQDKSASKKAVDFSGTWILDVGRSKPDENDRIESIKLTVTQTGHDIRVDSAVKLIPYDPAFMGGPMIRPLEQNLSNTFRFDGKETEGQIVSPVGPQPVKLKASFEGGKLHLSHTYGDPVVTFKETWTLSEDCKTLSVDRVSCTGRASVLVFTKKQ
jgi:hypothetical protein